MSDFDLERAMRDGCQTRDGRKVRILCDDQKTTTDPQQSVHGLIDEGKWEKPCSWDLDGKWSPFNESSSDLINLPRKRYTVMRESGPKGARSAEASGTWNNRKDAMDQMADRNGIGIFEWEES